VKKFMFIYRNPAGVTDRKPSPEEMQQMFAQWDAWRNKFKDEILDKGDGLQPHGKVLKASGVSDGPFTEAKEVLGGFSIVQAKSYEQALEVARACPIVHAPGSSIEIREMMGF